MIPLIPAAIIGVGLWLLTKKSSTPPNVEVIRTVDGVNQFIASLKAEAEAKASSTPVAFFINVSPDVVYRVARIQRGLRFKVIQLRSWNNSSRGSEWPIATGEWVGGGMPIIGPQAYDTESNEGQPIPATAEDIGMVAQWVFTGQLPDTMGGF